MHCHVRRFVLGLCLSVVGAIGCASPRAELPHFTVTADPHGGAANLSRVLDGLDRHAGGIGGVHVTCGDLVSPAVLWPRLRGRYGDQARWFGVVGNHDAERPETMRWLRNHFTTGHFGHPPLAELGVRPGPAGASETVYSWDYANAHLVVLNLYWDGSEEPGADRRTRGRIPPELMDWLRADLAATRQPFVFVFGHEPAFFNENGGRHRGDSLDADPDNRDAFWRLLVEHRVSAYISGHEHRRFWRQVDGVWQISAGKENSASEGRTALNVVLADDRAVVEVWTDVRQNRWWTRARQIRIAPRPTAGATTAAQQPADPATAAR